MLIRQTLQIMTVTLITQSIGAVAFGFAKELPTERTSRVAPVRSVRASGSESSTTYAAPSSQRSSRQNSETKDCAQNPSRALRKTSSSMRDVASTITESSGGYGSIVRNSCRVGNRGFGSHWHPILHKNKFHGGQDVPASEGTPVYAPADGVVISQGKHGGYGRMTVMKLRNGLQLEFAHLSRFGLSGAVKKGQIVGYVGHSGLATGPHLHLNVRKNGVLINPKRIFKNTELCGKKK